MTMVKPAHASGTVSPALTYCLYSSLNSWARPDCGLSSADSACALVGTTAQTTTGTQGGCKSGYYYWTVVSICPANTTSPTSPCICTDHYVPDSAGTSCVLPACPAHSSGTYPDACVCDAGYKVDPAGTSCIPVAVCPIPGLTPLTDQVAIDFDNNVGSRWRPDRLTPDYQAKLKCVEDGVDAATRSTGSYTGTSAYRPEQYQRHLFEIVEKDAELYPGYMTAHPECQALRDEITHEMGSQSGPPPGHHLQPGQEVADPGTSRHESGEAFDLTPIGLTAAQMAPIYAGCGVTHTAVRNEPWHVQ